MSLPNYPDLRAALGACLRNCSYVSAGSGPYQQGAPDNTLSCHLRQAHLLTVLTDFFLSRVGQPLSPISRFPNRCRFDRDALFSMSEQASG